MAETYPQWGKKGWLTVKTHQLRFPPVCVDCLQPATDAVTFRVGNLDIARTIMALGVFVVAKEMSIGLPVCRTCPAPRRKKGAILGVIIGLAVGAGTGFWFYSMKPIALPLIPIFAVVGVIFGFLMGRKFGYRLPARVGKYSARKETLQLRFDRPEYEKLYLDALKQDGYA